MSTSAVDQILPQEDHAIIGGVRLNLQGLLNEELLRPSSLRELAQRFRSAQPFPHLVLEDLFSPQLLERVHAEFDQLGWSQWSRYDNDHELKRGSLPNTRFGAATELYFNTVHSGRFLEVLSAITGIEGLVTDPALHGGGLHEIPAGGRFSMHIDFNHHPVTGLSNRLVLITYLNKDWRPSYGASLELWDFDTRERRVCIEPTFGRTVLMYQSSRSLHGHPALVDAPKGRTRRSAAAYFYTNGHADELPVPAHATLFPGASVRSRRDQLFNAAKYLLPPFLIDAGRKLRATLRPG